MNSKSFAFLSLLATLTTTLPAWADYTFKDGVLTVDGETDLSGKPLTFYGITSMTGVGSFTDSVGGGVLTLDVADGKTIKNYVVASQGVTCGVKFSGKLRLVKTGSGTLNIAGSPDDYATHDFTGGLEIRGGTVTSDKYAAMTKENTQFGQNAVIDVYPNGKIDLASPDHNKTTVNLYGGEITGPIRKYSDTKQCAAKINLEADSTIKPTKQFGVSGPIDLKGHQLLISLVDKLEWKPSSITAGTIVVDKGTVTVVGNVTNSKDANFTMTGTSALALGAFEYVVNDYSNDTSKASSGTGLLKVHGVFTPVTDTFYPCTLVDGSTINLSGKSASWSMVNSSEVAAKFAAGAMVTIDVGARDLDEGMKIVEWPEGTEYAGRKFVLKANGAVSEEYELQVTATGLTVAARGAKVPTATWTGVVDADATKPGNWSWEIESEPTDDMLPNGTTAVVIPWNKLANLNWPETNALSFATVEFSGEKPTEIVVLEGDRDWRGLGAMDIPFELDLKGHKLYILLPGAESTVETTVKSSVEGGELHASVAAGKTYNNTKVTLTDNLTLVKEGEGVFVQSNTAQSYTGGTRIEGGVLATPTADLSAEGVSLFGTVNKVTVAKGGALDPRGSYNWSDYTIVLDGGMISNTVANIGTNNDNTQYNIDSKNVNRRFNPNVTLLDNSTFATTKTYTFFATVDSDGHTLQNWIATDAEVRWQPKTKIGGKPLTMDVTGGGELFILKNCSLYQPTMTLKMTDGWVTMGGDMVVSNYVAASAKNSFDYRNDAAGLTVYGTFTPVTQRFIGCTMQNGSTIDLSEKKDVWSTQGFAWGKGTVDFATGATVTIDVSGRELSDDMRIVEWAATPTNLDGLTFKLDEESKADGYRIKKTDAGLFVKIDTGSELTVAEVIEALSNGKVKVGDKEIDLSDKTAAEINEIMNTSADNGLTVSANLILGIEQEKNGKFEKKPFLKADAGAQTKEDTITFSFGGIDPKFDKADIKYSIDSATSVGGDADGEGWTNLKSEQPFTDKGATATVELPKQDEPAVKYYRVTFEVSEKAVSGDPANQ